MKQALPRSPRILPVFLSYVLSFVYVAIYWNNHHHMLHTVEHVTGEILWANMHLLFWLSLMPFASAWAGENSFGTQPMAFYGFVLLMCAVAYYILQKRIIAMQGPHSMLAKAIGKDIKGKISPVACIAGIVLSFFSPMLSGAIYAVIALMWLVPDRRIERQLDASNGSGRTAGES